MEHFGTTHSRQATAKDPSGAQTFMRARLFNRHSVCAHVGHSLGNVAARNGLWFGHDLLATPPRLAGIGSLAENPRDIVGQIAKRRPNRFWPLCRRQCNDSGSRGGEKTGPSPVDRRKPGSKHHILTDGNGIPVVAHTSAANQHDVTELLELINDVPAIKGKVGAPRYRFDELYADRAYDSDPHRQGLRDVGITPHIARRNTKHGSGLGLYRWVVERTLSWLHQFRRLRIRYERRADIHQAFLTIACVLICHRYLKNAFC
jgi:transposase